jgi:hypothetical protein
MSCWGKPAGANPGTFFMQMMSGHGMKKNIQPVGKFSYVFPDDTSNLDSFM